MLTLLRPRHYGGEALSQEDHAHRSRDVELAVLQNQIRLAKDPTVSTHQQISALERSQSRDRQDDGWLAQHAASRPIMGSGHHCDSRIVAAVGTTGPTLAWLRSIWNNSRANTNTNIGLRPAFGSSQKATPHRGVVQCIIKGCDASAIAEN